MMPSASPFRGATAAGRLPAVLQGVLSAFDATLLGFVTEMNAVQLDQLAALLEDWGEPAGEAAGVAHELVARLRAARYAETEQLSLGQPWVWANRRGLDAFGLRTRLVRPSVRLLRHTHAVTDLRLAVQRTAAFREGGAWWRAERTILSETGFPGRPEHVPDGEVRWPAGTGSPWAGEAWAVEVEISRSKSVEATAKIMREVLAQVGGIGWAPAGTPVPGVAPRYARLVYACSPDTIQRVLNARAEVGSPLSARIDVHELPESAMRLNTPKRGW